MYSKQVFDKEQNQIAIKLKALKDILQEKHPCQNVRIYEMKYLKKRTLRGTLESDVNKISDSWSKLDYNWEYTYGVDYRELGIVCKELLYTYDLDEDKYFVTQYYVRQGVAVALKDKVILSDLEIDQEEKEAKYRADKLKQNQDEEIALFTRIKDRLEQTTLPMRLQLYIDDDDKTLNGVDIEYSDIIEGQWVSYLYTKVLAGDFQKKRRIRHSFNIRTRRAEVVLYSERSFPHRIGQIDPAGHLSSLKLVSLNLQQEVELLEILFDEFSKSYFEFSF